MNACDNLSYLDFPIHPSNAYTSSYPSSSPIHHFIQKYYDSQWIALSECIQFHTTQEFLKRQYKHSEYEMKIRLLGEYYRYHFEAPRIFIPGVCRILEDNMEEKRVLEYATVTKHMQGRQQIPLNAFGTYRIHKRDKIIKDVELSYDNFEDKPPKKQVPAQSQHSPCRCSRKSRKKGKGSQPLTQNEGMKRVASINCKGTFVIFKPKQKEAAVECLKEPEVAWKETVRKYKKPVLNTTKRGEVYLHQRDNNKKSSAKSSKIASVNNSSHASHKGMSKSKSKVQLDVLKGRVLDTNKQTGNQFQSNFASVHNSMLRCESNNNMLNYKNQGRKLSSQSSKLRFREGSKGTSNKDVCAVSKRRRKDSNVTDRKGGDSLHQTKRASKENQLKQQFSSAGYRQFQQEERKKKMFSKVIQIKRSG